MTRRPLTTLGCQSAFKNGTLRGLGVHAQTREIFEITWFRLCTMNLETIRICGVAGPEGDNLDREHILPAAGPVQHSTNLYGLLVFIVRAASRAILSVLWRTPGTKRTVFLPTIRPSVAMSVRTRRMFVIPFAINLCLVAVILRQGGILSCNQRAHNSPMFAIPTVDVCRSLQLQA